jgi:hypothetical protein
MMSVIYAVNANCHNLAFYAGCHYAGCHYAECYYAECRSADQEAFDSGVPLGLAPASHTNIRSTWKKYYSKTKFLGLSQVYY